MAMSADGKTLAVVANDDKRVSPGSTSVTHTGQPVPEVTLWDVATGSKRKLFAEPVDYQNFLFTPDGSSLIFLVPSSRQESTVVWDVNSGKERFRVTADYPCGLSADGQLLATRARGKGIRLWEIQTGKEVLTIPQAGEPVWEPEPIARCPSSAGSCGAP
jgi:WD40 repeat protein